MRIFETACTALISAFFTCPMALAADMSNTLRSEQFQKSKIPNYRALPQDNGPLSSSQHFFGEKAIGYRGTPAPGCFGCPLGIATDKNNGEIYIADFRLCRVQVYNSKGEFLYIPGEKITTEEKKEYPGIENDFVSHDSIFEDVLDIIISDNNIYVIDSFGRSLKVFSKQWYLVREIDLHKPLNLSLIHI